jgi:predicted O-linked N-acetylglucosamine transferase (SPINDLY family)
VSPDRVELVQRRPHRQYLELISQVDIALDAFPFNGHTTTCDCLWQGVPVVALTGDSYVSRFGSSGLMSLGLDQLVVDSVEQYIDAAARLAADLAGLRELRATMRERMQESPLMDFVGFTRDLESAYRQMWQSWCQADSGSGQNDLTGLWRG